MRCEEGLDHQKSSMFLESEGRLDVCTPVG